MTDNWLQEARARAEAATEGPWKAWHVDSPGYIGYKVTRLAGTILPTLKADADFIAHARTDLPLALDLLVSAEKLLRAVEWIDDDGVYVPWCPWCKNFKHAGHADDCGREAWLACLDAGGSE